MICIQRRGTRGVRNGHLLVDRVGSKARHVRVDMCTEKKDVATDEHTKALSYIT